MFSLIITLISIVLVVVLVAAVIYYGGTASAKSAVRLAASTLVAQAQQINAAGTIAVSQGASWPLGAPQFSPPYLTSMPVPPKSAYVAVTPSAADWTYYVPDVDVHHFVLKNKVSKDVCMAVNHQLGLVGIPAVWTGTDLVQCFGAGTPTGPNNELAYTFFYDPLGSTPAGDAMAMAQSTAEATAAGAAAPAPGYPRLCPDNSTITSGVCVDSDVLASDTPPPPPPADDVPGFLIVTGVSGDFNPTITSEGFATSCPAGAIDPTTAAAAPVGSNPLEQFNVDGVMRTGWELQPDFTSPFTTYLTRTWCFPAMSSEAIPAGIVTQAVWAGLDDVALNPSVPGANPADYHESVNAVVTFTVKGQAWTVIASGFEADVLGPTDNNPWMVGDKLAVARGSSATRTYFDGVPTLVYNGTTYAGETGTITFNAPGKFFVPTLSFSTGGYGFEATAVSLASTPVSVSISNLTSGLLTFASAPAVTGPFQIIGTTCGPTLAKGGTCTATVSFNPTVEGGAAGTITADGGNGPESLELSGWAQAAPMQGFWVLTAQLWYDRPNISNEGFQLTCPNGGIDPTSTAVTPILGLNAAETLTVDGVMDQEWVSYSEAKSTPTALTRTYCIPLLSSDMGNVYAPAFIGTMDRNIKPDASQWQAWSLTSTKAQIATATIRVSGVDWTLAAVSGQADGQNFNFTPTSGMSYFVRKIAIGRAAQFAGTYYGAGPARVDQYGAQFTDEGLIRFGVKGDPVAPVELSLSKSSAYGLGNIGVTSPGFDEVSILNSSANPVQISGIGVVGVASPFTSTTNCGATLAPHASCQVSLSFTPTGEQEVYDSLVIETSVRSYTVDLTGTGLP